MSGTDEVDYRIEGSSTQYVEIELDPGESAVAEAGAMMYKDADIEMSSILGDASGQEGGFFGKLAGAGKRLISGEGLFTTVFTHNGSGKAHVGFSAPYPGTILPIKLSDVGGTLICQKDSFLAAAKGVSMGIAFKKKILTGLFGGARDSSSRSWMAMAGCLSIWVARSSNGNSNPVRFCTPIPAVWPS